MKILLRLTGYSRAHWRLLVVIIAAMASDTGLRAFPAWLSKTVIDTAATEGTPRYLLLLVGVYFGVTLLARGISSVQNYCTEWLGQNVVFDLRNDLYRHLQSQSMSFFDANQTGQLMSRVTSDVGQVQQFVSRSTLRIADSLIGFAMYLTLLFMLDVQLTFVALAAIPVIIFVQSRLRRIYGIFRELSRMMAQVSNILQENIAAIKLVKAYGREDYESKRFLDQYWAVRNARLRSTRLMTAWSQTQEISAALSNILVLYFGVLRVMDGSLTIGTLFAFQAYVQMMWQPVRFFSEFNSSIQQAMASGERIFEIIDWPLDVAEKPDARALPPLQGDLALDGVSFAYGKDAPLLHNISIDVPAGTSLAIVGPSGSGKSTLINLIPRFYDVSQGRVLIDGHDVRDVTLQSLRSQIGMVLQETFLFNMTIRENIKYGREEASDEDVEAAARAANAHDFVMEFPEGYDTLIGERGVRLSGGQRQRLAIARAILVDPRILILDEATSSVDTRTDFLIQRALQRLMEGRTTVVIAHRLSTVQRATQIAYLENGRVIGKGRHEDLLVTCPQYRHLYETQFRDQKQHDEGEAAAEPVAGDRLVGDQAEALVRVAGLNGVAAGGHRSNGGPGGHGRQGSPDANGRPGGRRRATVGDSRQ